jgi:hypothetical protein
MEGEARVLQQWIEALAVCWCAKVAVFVRLFNARSNNATVAPPMANIVTQSSIDPS